MTDDKKPIRGWGETSRAGGTMRDLRALRQLDSPPPQIDEEPAAAAANPSPTIVNDPPPVAVTEIQSVRRPRKGQTKRGRQPNIDVVTPIESFIAFRARWKQFLRKGQMQVCEALYSKTHAVGQTSCVTSYSELAQLSGLKLRQCFNIISQLEALGFIERTRNANSSNKHYAGSTIHFFLTPKK